MLQKWITVSPRKRILTDDNEVPEQAECSFYKSLEINVFLTDLIENTENQRSGIIFILGTQV